MYLALFVELEPHTFLMPIIRLYQKTANLSINYMYFTCIFTYNLHVFLHVNLHTKLKQSQNYNKRGDINA